MEDLKAPSVELKSLFKFYMIFCVYFLLLIAYRVFHRLCH